MRTRHLVAAAALASTVIAAISITTVAHAAAAQLTAAFSQTSIWTGGYGGQYLITNSGDAAVTGWTVEFDLPSGSTVTSSWRSVRIRAGQHYRFSNAAYNGDIQPAATENFGFNVAGTGQPLNCTIADHPCAGGGGGGDSQPPSVPGNVRSTATTSTSVSLAWDAATDNIGVTAYQVSRDGTTVATVATTSATVDGLTAATSYAFTVKARDAAGNTSAASDTLTVTTSAGSGAAIVDVATAAELRTALANTRPGQTIRLAPGTYAGPFVATTAGTASQHVTLTGPATAVLTNAASGTAPSCPAPTAGWNSGYGFWVFNAAYWDLTGFTVAGAKKGIVIDNSPHTAISGVSVHDTDEEGVHFRRSSSDSSISDSRITSTGLVSPGFGEGVYIGSAGSNWGCHGNSGGADRSDRVQVVGNHIGPLVAAEGIDVKEGTFDGVIRGNTFDGRGVSGANSADSWVDVKGIGYTIENNTGTFTSPGTFANGYETHNPTTTPSFPNGCGNVWRGNVSDLGGVGDWAINVTSTSNCSSNPNLVYASNSVTNAVRGLTNIPVTP
jgi:chitodextrinase